MEAWADATVYAVDFPDDLNSFEVDLLKEQGVQLKLLNSIDDLLLRVNVEAPGCVLVYSTQSGDQVHHLLREFNRCKVPLDIVLIAKDIRIEQAVEVVRNGAYTVIEWPCSNQFLLSTVKDSIARSAAELSRRKDILDLMRKFRALTEDELQVLEALVHGEGNKQIALRFDVSPRTIDRRKRALYNKLNVESLSDLLLAYIRWTQVDSTVESI